MFKSCFSSVIRYQAPVHILSLSAVPENYPGLNPMIELVSERCDSLRANVQKSSAPTTAASKLDQLVRIYRLPSQGISQDA